MNCSKHLSTVAASLLLLSPIALTACGPGEASHLVVTQSTDVPSSSDHKSHLAPGVFIGITLSIRNTGAGAARGVTVEDVLPAGFRYYELTTLGGMVSEVCGKPSLGVDRRVTAIIGRKYAVRPHVVVSSKFSR